MLKAGDRLGAYEVIAPLGAGGMGEVYRARDTRLDRTVAVKLLSGELARTPEAEARFQREARAIAALQHPNICVLHDVGSDGGASYLVMEYLEGETLAERLRRGPLPLAQLQALGGQIAAALARAHRAGIVHRDLKPANIMLTGLGAQTQAKLLDFGLAKAGVGTALTAAIDTPTMPAATQAGAVLGTIPYMAPEQIAGREADARSDIYALGCVLYEMATAQPAFSGMRELTPPALDRLVRACREADPEARLQSAHDVAMMLAAVSEAPDAVAPAAGGRGWRWAAAAVVAAAGVVAAALWLRPAAAAARTVTEITPPPGLSFDFGGSRPGPPAVSPDGRQVVFSAQNSSGRSALWLRSLDSLEARELPGTQGGVFPFWSPDGRSIGYFTSMGPGLVGKLMVISLAGGLPRTLAAMRTARGGSWSAAAGGTLVVSPSVTGGLLRIPAQGGEATAAVPFNAAQFDSLRFPSFLPDGKHFLYLAINHSDSTQDAIFLASLDGGAPKLLVHSLTAGIYADGRLLYSSDRTLMAQPLDPATGTLSGSPQPVARDVFEDSVTWRAAYSASRNGVLVYAGGDAGEQQLAWADRSGQLSPPLPAYSGEAFTAAVAPDGRQVAVSLDQGLQDIWVERAPGRAFDRLTFGPVANLYPVWSPDSKWIAYAAGGTGNIVLRRPAAGGPEQTVSRAPDAGDLLAPAAWSADGRELLCAFYPTQGAKAVVAISVAGGAVRTLATLGNQELVGAALSSDDRWVSYLAGQQGQPTNVYLVPFHGGGSGAVWQATSTGVVQQFWTQGGHELDVIDNAGRLVAIPVSSGADGAPVFGAPHTLADHFPAAVAAAGDGQRFLVTTYPHDHQRLVVVNGWSAGH
jgi:Tol biopolymer transport system component